jgi:hypothetical protein
MKKITTIAAAGVAVLAFNGCAYYVEIIETATGQKPVSTSTATPPIEPTPSQPPLPEPQSYSPWDANGVLLSPDWSVHEPVTKAEYDRRNLLNSENTGYWYGSYPVRTSLKGSWTSDGVWLGYTAAVDGVPGVLREVQTCWKPTTPDYAPGQGPTAWTKAYDSGNWRAYNECMVIQNADIAALPPQG